MFAARFALLATCLTLASTAGAEALKGFSGPVVRATTWKNTCGQVQALVARRGYAVLVYGRGSVLHDAAGPLLFGGDVQDRVVADHTYCLPRQSTRPIWVPTRDNAQCFAGYTCMEADSDRSGRGGRR